MSNGIIEENVEGEVDGDMSTCKYKVHKETDKEWEKGKGRQTPGKRNSPNRWQGQREAGERCNWVFRADAEKLSYFKANNDKNLASVGERWERWRV